MNFISLQNKSILNHQLKTKLLIKNDFDRNDLSSIHGGITLLKQNSLKNANIVENLLLLELVTGHKSFIKSLKRKYKEIDLYLATNIKDEKKLFELLLILNSFYFPMIKRRNLNLKNYFDKQNNFLINIREINILPFNPKIFFKWNKILSLNFIFSKSTRNKTKLYLRYYGFII